ncbi:MAG: hypothetical protein LBC18_08775 [Opitutaceae bacterium]|jgi:hypothetical protein|nr:hypothetical protein [Opitutaceae bacterium]
MKTTRRFYIVNEFDRPDKQFICERAGDLLYYFSEYLRLRFPKGFTLERATPVEEFGFDITAVGKGLFKFEKVRSSTATYRDGKPRQWQGDESFTLK